MCLCTTSTRCVRCVHRPHGEVNWNYILSETEQGQVSVDWQSVTHGMCSHCHSPWEVI